MTEQKKDRRLGFALILFVLLLLSLMINLIKGPCDTCNVTEDPTPNTSDSDFGNNTIGGCIIGDAQLITTDGRRVQKDNEGFEASAAPPAIITNSTWDTGLDGWTASNAVQDSSQGYYMSDGSINMSVPSASTSQLTKSVSQEVEPENTFKIVFWVNLTNTLDTGEYLILRISFSGGNSLVYLLNGSYTPTPTEKKVDVRSDLDKLNLWSGVKLAGIEEDYKSQWGVTTVPDFSGLQFQYYCVTPDEEIHLDEFLFIRLPIADDEGYWIDDDTNRVIYAVVELEWNITISDIVNSSNVWLELELFVQIEDFEFSIIAPWDLAQIDLFQVTQFNTRVLWTSRTIELPIDDSVYGDELNYNWTIFARAYGEIENSTTWVDADGQLEGFDTFHIQWIEADGEINVELYVVVGSFGSLGILGAIGVSQKKKQSAKMYN